MVNESYQPDSVEDDVMTVLRDEERVNAVLVRERTGHGRREINNALSNLCTAGWAKKVARGLYDYVSDPRVESTESVERNTAAMKLAQEELADWNPDNINSKKARKATIEVVKWLATQSTPKQKGEIQDWETKHDAAAGVDYSPSTWWKAVKAGLRELSDAGVVEHQRNVGYKISDTK